MGMTDELAIGHYFKRLTVIDSEFGKVDPHLKRYTDLSAADMGRLPPSKAQAYKRQGGAGAIRPRLC